MKKSLVYVCLYGLAGLALTLLLQHSFSFTEPVMAQSAIEFPFFREWSVSAHADLKAEAFSHWNQDEPQEIPVACAKCHSTPGYRDFIGADGSTPGKVDRPAPVGTSVECIACHSAATYDLDRVLMPSGIELTGLGKEARCMQCHQGRASKFSIDTAIQDANLTDPDTVSPKLEFINIHYYAAVATKYGTLAKSGYEYAGQAYDGHFTHVDDFDPCIACHDPHTQQIKLTECQQCHTNVKERADLKNIRMYGSLVDYDGDGNLKEGIYYEIQGLQQLLYQTIQMYAREKSGTPLIYGATKFPYFFVDTNANGQTDAEEVVLPNKYTAWTARLLKAAYNYQISIRDPGTFAHGGKYIIELLYDSIADLNTVLAKPVSLAGTHRIDDGHFAGSEAAFRHWDSDGKIPATCSKCHSAAGLPLFLNEDVTMSQKPGNGLKCTTCHDDLNEFSRYKVANVHFPSGAVIDSGDAETNLCMNCHQGRESTVSVNTLLAGLPEDQVADTLQFLNVHYFAAGATRFGTAAKGGYEYAGKTYVDMFTACEIFKQPIGDRPAATGCLSCHTAHGLEVETARCTTCHPQAATSAGVQAIRTSPVDYDGDGNTTEGLAQEIATLQQALFVSMQDYAREVAQTPLIYDANAYPYFFQDTNRNGQVDADELTAANQYHAWTPKLLKAAYNYQYAAKDPGGFAHNGKYILQLLYDSLESLKTQSRVNLAHMVRP